MVISFLLNTNDFLINLKIKKNCQNIFLEYNLAAQDYKKARYYG